MLTAKETELERLERLAYLKDEDPSYTREWERLRDKLWTNKETDKYKRKKKAVWIFFPNGERQTFKSVNEVRNVLGISDHTINEYIDTDIPIKQRKFKGCYIYSLEEE
ncbi:MAG: hypothetical protein L0L22_14120 [Staphylococcus equorum]|nr:hypothetical protein [Staphylococcus equorum]